MFLIKESTLLEAAWIEITRELLITVIRWLIPLCRNLLSYLSYFSVIMLYEEKVPGYQEKFDNSICRNRKHPAICWGLTKIALWLTKFFRLVIHLFHYCIIKSHSIWLFSVVMLQTSIQFHQLLWIQTVCSFSVRF